jgi:hypothetical protein
MESMPPPGSLRRRFAVGLQFALTLLFVSFLLYRLFNWITQGGPFPILAAIGGVGGFVGMWRWTLHELRKPAPGSNS